MLSIIQKLLFAFVTLIIGLSLIGQIATSTQTLTNAVGVSDETIDITGALISKTSSVVNITHGTTFNDKPSMYGTHVLPTVTETSGKDLACTKPVVTNATSGTLIDETNWYWASTIQARGRCGIVLNASNFPSDQFNNSKWNFTYTVTYENINSSVQLSIAQTPTGWKITDCPINTIILKNGTTVITQDTDYTYSSAAQIRLLPTLINNYTATSSYAASYSYCADGYLNSSWSRSALNLVSGFFALAMMIFSVTLFYSIGREVGII